MEHFLEDIGGYRMNHTVDSTGEMLSLPVPEGFRLRQVYDVLVNGACATHKSACRCDAHRRLTFDANGATVRVGGSQFHIGDEIEVRYGVVLRAGHVPATIPDDLYDLSVTAVAAWVKSHLAASGTSRSARRIGEDFMNEFKHFVTLAKAEISRRGVNAEWTFGGPSW
jgi:hypothetical protein